jgi:hypothetical protein
MASSKAGTGSGSGSYRHVKLLEDDATKATKNRLRSNEMISVADILASKKILSCFKSVFTILCMESLDVPPLRGDG